MPGTIEQIGRLWRCPATSTGVGFSPWRISHPCTQRGRDSPIMRVLASKMRGPAPAVRRLVSAHTPPGRRSGGRSGTVLCMPRSACALGTGGAMRDKGLQVMCVSTRHRFARLVSALACAGVLASAVACGPATGPTVIADRAPVVIEHGMGSTAFDDVPQRIVALSGSWADSLLALGVQPVGVGTLTGFGPADGKLPWQGDYDAHVVALSLVGAPDYEAIAALNPDLILADYSANTPAVYQKLSEIAPTIAQLKAGGFVSPWRDQVRTLGRALRLEDRAEELVTETEATIASVRDTFPGAAGKTFTIATLGGSSVGIIGSESDSAATVLGDLGLRLDPAVIELGKGRSRLTVSYEQARAALLADMVLIRSSREGESLEAMVPGWDSLPAVRSGATVLVDRPLAGAISDPSVLNIGLLLESIRPALAKLAA